MLKQKPKGNNGPKKPTIRKSKNKPISPGSTGSKGSLESLAARLCIALMALEILINLGTITSSISAAVGEFAIYGLPSLLS